MNNSFERKEMISAAYRLTFQALRTLWRETILAATIIVLSAIIQNTPSDPFGSISGPFKILTNIVELVLLLPYVIAIYRCALRLPLLSIAETVREAINRKMFFVYNMFWCLYTMIIDLLEYLPEIYLFAAHIVVIIVTAWAMLRLFAIGPALAIDCCHVTVNLAYKATAGRVRALLVLGFRTFLPFMAVAGIFGLLLTFGYYIASDVFPGIDLNLLSFILRLIFLVPVNLFAMVLCGVLEAQVFDALVLSNISHDAR